VSQRSLAGLRTCGVRVNPTRGSSAVFCESFHRLKRGLVCGDRRSRDATADPEGLQKLVEKDEEKTPTKVFIVALDKDTLLGCVLCGSGENLDLNRVRVAAPGASHSHAVMGAAVLTVAPDSTLPPGRRSGQRARKRPAGVPGSAWRFTGLSL